MVSQEENQDQDQGQQGVLEMSTGVKLQLLTPSPILLHNAMKAAMRDEPKPPVVFIKDKGRDEDNPADPDYIAAHQMWLADTGIRNLRALIPTGTRMVFKPDHLVGPEDEDFDDLLESLGEASATGRHGRYIQWVMLVACGADDLKELATHLMRRAGVREEDVREAQALFSGNEKRRANNGTSTERGSEHRSPVRTARTRSRTRN